jgi:signal transduction histidine kinase
LERQLIQLERLSLAGLMVSAVSHEVATPLSLIANTAEMLLLDSQRESATASELKKIVVQARRVAEMTRRMLDFVRPKPSELTALDIVALAYETLDLLKFPLRKGRIQASICAGTETPMLWGDRAQLQQVLFTLFTNSIQAMKNGGTLAVTVQQPEANRQGEEVVVNVDDTGPGISPQVMERMFDFFFTTKTGEGGTGLGLAISKQIIERHGGTIRAENIEGGGARLSFKLPGVAAGQASGPRRVACSASAGA